ncbi:MAG: glycosyltransferase family 2 protein, partial [Pseudomonadota bacterium]
MADGESILQHRTKLTRERAAIMAPPPTPELQSFKSLRRYLTSGQAPWRRVARRRSEILCDASRISEEDVTYGRGRPFPLKDYRFVQPVAFRELLRRRFVNEITADATDGFADSNPDQSARRILSPTQKTLLTISILAVALAFAHAPLFVIIAFNIVVTAYFLFAVIYRFFLLIISLNPKTPKTTPLSPDQLPTVTILVPLYDEAKSVSRLLRSLRALDYPQEKLDIKLLLEGDDRNTIEEVRRHKL